MYPNSLPRVVLLVMMILGMASLTCSTPGHLVHDYYKCESEYYKNTFLRCKEERREEEEQRRRRNGEEVSLGGRNQGRVFQIVLMAGYLTWTWK